MSDIEEQSSDHLTRYSLTFSLDRGNFFRRVCSSCGRHFKTKAEPGEIASILHPAFQRLELEIGDMQIVNHENPQEERSLYCPYCGHYDVSSNMLTLEFSKYLERYAMREIVLPRINKMFSDFTDSFTTGRRSSRGVFSIEVKHDHSSSALPPRPISGPELPDMICVDFLCCYGQGKILDSWNNLVICPFCGTKAILQ